jgi:hypothetical protein
MSSQHGRPSASSVILVAITALLSTTPAPATVRVTRHVVVAQRRVVIRVPAASHRAQAAPVPPKMQNYRERRGPRCIPASALAGAAVTAPDSIDLILRGGDRVRARLDDDCPALDFYRGFYIIPPPDGRICADRDAIRTRSGAECAIDRFRALVAKP